MDNGGMTMVHGGMALAALAATALCTKWFSVDRALTALPSKFAAVKEGLEQELATVKAELATVTEERDDARKQTKPTKGHASIVEGKFDLLQATRNVDMAASFKERRALFSPDRTDEEIANRVEVVRVIRPSRPVPSHLIPLV